MTFKTCYGSDILMNVIQDPATFDDLCSLGAFELLSLFQDLEAPAVDEMNGDYAATLLRQPGALAEIGGFLAVGLPWKSWLSKGFRPVSETEGCGYNSFRRFGRTVQQFPMRTLVAPSRYDGRPSYTLVYSAYRSTCGAMNMVDEVRRVDDGLYLGIGTWGYSNRQRQVPLPFALCDTGRPYTGDIGGAKKDFVLSEREIPALASRGLS